MKAAAPCRMRRSRARIGIGLATALMSACGGTGTTSNSGTTKTTLSVEVADAEGDALRYEWRVTAGSIENRNSKQTVWSMPDGQGLHFAYVTVSDGKGGHVEQQYAVSSDTLGTSAPQRQPMRYAPPTFALDAEGTTVRLRFTSSINTTFAASGGAPSAFRSVYLPDIPVEVRDPSGLVVFSGLTDLSGEVALPKLQDGPAVQYAIRCARSQDAPLEPCSPATLSVNPNSTARVVAASASGLTAGQNLRLYGHVALADGGVCGQQNEYFGIQAAATVQLRSADGTALTGPLRVNRFGDYALDAAVLVPADLRLRVRCEGFVADVRLTDTPAVYLSTAPVELSYVIPNSRPRFLKMVANGPEGNVRGKMILPEVGDASNALPGPSRFLAYKGQDTKRSACIYYRALGAVAACDAQGNMIDPISFDDWKRQNKFGLANGANDIAANYINKRDLNLVRRMVATKVDANNIAFYVCNHPGPVGTSQVEIDEMMSNALSDLNRVACVAMEWTPSPGVNNGAPFTKFLTFGPDGALLASVNLDGRGEKYMPGTCVACHGGTSYKGRFPEKGSPSPYLGSRFLPFDTGNYYFGSGPALTESAQGNALKGLNLLVRETEGPGADTATTRLIDGWYLGRSSLDKLYVPQPWKDLEDISGSTGAKRFYREVVGTSCRTCHTALGSNFDWDSRTGRFLLAPNSVNPHFCGGSDDLAINAAMPNALISRDRLFDLVRSDASLAELMKKYLGCAAPLPDPVYPQR